MVRLKALQDQILVITGATSGIGLTTARMAAARGVRGLVLVARSQLSLQRLEREINTSGSRTTAITYCADVADEAALTRVAELARSRFGGFDTWVNNAGVGIYGRVLEVSNEDHRRLFETNYWGVVYGSRIAVEHLKDRGGSLINVGSTLSDLPIPVQGLYAATKHAVKGFTDALRMEIEEAGLPVSVTLIKPSSINTPYPFHARNYMDEAPDLPPPVYAPELVAQTILYAAESPVRELFVGGAGKAYQLAERYVPRLTHRYMERITISQMQTGRPREGRDNLHVPGNDLRQYGDHKGMVRKTSLYTATMTHPRAAISLCAGAGLIGAAIWLLKQGTRKPLHVPACSAAGSGRSREIENTRSAP